MSRPRFVRAAAAMVAALFVGQLASIPASAEDSPSAALEVVEESTITSPPLILESDAGHVVNSTLTIKPGDWGPSPVSLSYSWTRDGEAIAGATGASYTLTSEDLYRFVQGFVTGSKEGYPSVTSPTAQVGPIRPAMALTRRSAVVTGVPQVGSILTEVGPAWEPAAVTRTHQWLRDGEPIDGATASSYTPVIADIGARISVQVTGSKPGYMTDSWPSARTAAVQPAGFTAQMPTIGGLFKVDQTLTAIPGAWSPAPDAFTYQWNRNGVPLAGATGPTYATTSDDYQKYISVTVTATREGLPPTSFTSEYAGIHRGQFISPVPTIEGALRAGSTVSVATGEWTPGASLSIQWLRNGSHITGATGSTYTLQRADIDARISVMVSATKTGYFPYSVSSTQSHPITGTLREFSGDGHADVIARDSIGRLWLYAGNPAGGWQPRRQIGKGWGTFTNIIAPGDYNADGFGDVLARDSKGVLYLYPGNGSGGWRARTIVDTGWNEMTAIVGPGDFTGNGGTDLLARDKQGGLYLYHNDGSGTKYARMKVGTGWNVFSSIVAPGDFNGDGKADILARDAKGLLWLYPSAGKNFGWKPRIKVGTGWNAFTSIVGPGDFNSDGNVDLLARTSDGALWLYPGNGSGGWKPRSKVGIGWNIFNTIL